MWIPSFSPRKEKEVIKKFLKFDTLKIYCRMRWNREIYEVSRGGKYENPSLGFF